jgi:hypothetical protein
MYFETKNEPAYKNFYQNFFNTYLDSHFTNYLLAYSMGGIVLLDILDKLPFNRNIHKIVIMGSPILYFKYEKVLRRVEQKYKNKIFIFWNKYDTLSTPGHLELESNDIMVNPSPFYLFFFRRSLFSHLYWFYPHYFFNNFYNYILK